MQRHRVRFLKSGPRRFRSRQRGVALITTLLLLMLLSGLALAMAWSARSDMLINGYYRSFRGSFYAADSGINIARQTIQNRVMSEFNNAWNGNTAPFSNPTQTATDAATDVTNFFSSYTHLNGSGQGQAANSWPADFKVQQDVDISGNPIPFVTYHGCTMQGGVPCASPVTTSYVYQFDYDLVAVGQSRGGEAATIGDHGSLFVTFPLSATGGNLNFSAWGMFIDQFDICSGTLVPGTITGPTFTNGAWTFGTGGSYKFTDQVGSASKNFGYANGNTCDQTANTSDSPGGVTIAPTFKVTPQLGQPKVGLPQNDFDQKRAVLDGIGQSGNNPVNPSDLHFRMKDVSGNPYPNGGASTGVFLPYKTMDGDGNPIPPTFSGGGIYVEGDATVTLQPLGTSAQVYTITQGSTTTTITIDPVAKTTLMSTGGTTQVIQGVPTMLDATTGAAMSTPYNPTAYNTMLYVNGNITSLSGPGEGQTAIQDATALTITAAKDVSITGDIKYHTEPVTLSASGNTPIDSLVAGGDTKQALGIFTATGNINLNDTQTNSSGKFDGMLEIDASLAMISNNGKGGLVNTGNQINTLTIVGGRIQNTIQNINTLTRNVLFDKRFGGSFSPPWFPSGTPTGGTITPGTPTAKFSSLQWINHTPFD